MRSLAKKIISLFLVVSILYAPFSPLTQKTYAIEGAAAVVLNCTGLGDLINSAISGLMSSALSSLTGGLLGGEVPVRESSLRTKESCMDAIAYSLAKTALAMLTDSIVNWINNGFEGNPFYIGDTGSFFRNTIRGQFELALQDIEEVGSIYFDLIRQTTIYNARKTLQDELGFTLDSDIVSALCGYAQYEASDFCNEQLTPEAQQELTRAFTRGDLPFDWSIWESMTQNCGNNFFCVDTTAQRYILSQAETRVQQLNTELNRGSGFLSQKECVDENYEEDLANWEADMETYLANDPGVDDFVGPPDLSSGTFPSKPECREYTIKTPGKIIADKLTSNLETGERQLELADELNEALATIFDALLNKLITDGLRSFTGDGEDDYYQELRTGESGFNVRRTSEALSESREVCEAVGGTFDEELEVCDLENTSQEPTLPPFPWQLEDGTIISDYQGVAAFRTNFPSTCLDIGGVRIVPGNEPCITGESTEDPDDGGDGQNTFSGQLSITPAQPRIGQEITFSVTGGEPNTEFEVVYTREESDTVDFLTSGTTNAQGNAQVRGTIPGTQTGSVTIFVMFVGGGEVSQQITITQ